MSPILTPTRTDVIAKLKASGASALPFVFGRGEPEAVLRVEDDGVFRLRLLQLDPNEREAMDAAREKSLAERHGWMPEHVRGWLRPMHVVIEAKSVEELIKKLEKAKWKSSPNE